MPIDPETTTRRVREHVGEELRWIVRYRGEHLDPERDRLYIRDDLEPLLGEYDLVESVRAIILAEPMAETQEEKLDMENHRLTLRYYDDAILLNVPYHEGAGLIISIDSTAVIDLPALIEFLETLDRHTDDER